MNSVRESGEMVITTPVPGASAGVVGLPISGYTELLDVKLTLRSRSHSQFAEARLAAKHP
jgi:hypothetical protein